MNFRRFFVLLAVVFSAAFVYANDANPKKKADRNTREWYYELEPVDTPFNGVCKVKVWSYAPDIVTARDQAMKNAVHGIMFRGLPADKDRRLYGMPPLVDDVNAEITHKDFLDSFFSNGGEYLRYATKTYSDSSNEIVKYGRKNYKVGVVVTVQYDRLRKNLESRGIIRSLTSGFAK